MTLNVRDAIGLLVVGAFVCVVGLLFFVIIPEQNKDVVNFALGQLSGFVAGAFGFYYVASKSDETKTANTGKAFEAITATAHAASGSPDAAPIVAAVKRNTEKIVDAVEGTKT